MKRIGHRTLEKGQEIRKMLIILSYKRSKRSMETLKTCIVAVFLGCNEGSK